MQITHRGIVHLDLTRQAILSKDRSVVERAIRDHRSNFMISYTGEQYQLHVVDRLALFPLFYTIKDGVPHVSQIIDDLLPMLSNRVLHPEGYYGTGGMAKGNRTPYSPYAGIMRIPPGHYLEYKAGKYELVQYWSFLDLSDRPFEGSYEEACDILGTLIKQGVDRCYDYSPNLAVHLSGGLDSGSVTALLAQSKKDTIHAYAHVKPDAPDDHPTNENGYLRKYVSCYPNIAVQKSHTLPLHKDLIRPIDPMGNWHSVRHDSPEGRICQDLTKKGISYILSGMGGDELASFGHGHQIKRRSIHSEADARRFMYREIHLKRKARLLIKGILGMDGPRIDSIRSTMMISSFTEKHKMYHPKFRAQVKDLREGNLISLYWFPSSYQYRLETLQRSFFTVRSDIWNYLSKYYGIDYMFPLLDADLIEFCASLPREFFIGKEQRQMIKTGLAKYLPAELLSGGKRPGYQPPLSDNAQPGLVKDYRETVEECLETISEHRDSLAAKVYDLSFMIQQVDKYSWMLSKTPMTRYQSRKIAERKIQDVQRSLLHATYVNGHFDDIL